MPDDITNLQQDPTKAVSGDVGRTPAGFVSLSGSSLTPITSPDYVQPNPTPIYPAGSIQIPTPAAPILSDPEQKISDLTKELSGLLEADVGKTAFTAQEEQTFGLQSLKDTQTSLSKQLLGLQAEAKNIPDIMQQQSIGRGITEAGLNPLTTAALRENSIKANILGAQLNAIQLDVASAQDQIDKAVQMQFGPLEEEIKAKQANIQALKEDPAISLAEKNRANQQEILLKQQEFQIAQQKANQADIWKTSTTAAANLDNFTPTDQYPVAAVALKAIQNAPTKEIAQQIAAATGLVEKAQRQSITTILGDDGKMHRVSYNQQTGEMIDLGIASATKPTSAGEKLNQDAKLMNSEIQKVLGPDSFINPQDWQDALNEWTSAGHKASDFIQRFKNFANPNDTYVGL